MGLCVQLSPSLTVCLCPSSSFSFCCPCWRLRFCLSLAVAFAKPLSLPLALQTASLHTSSDLCLRFNATLSTVVPVSTEESVSTSYFWHFFFLSSSHVYPVTLFLPFKRLFPALLSVRSRTLLAMGMSGSISFQSSVTTAFSSSVQGLKGRPKNVRKKDSQLKPLASPSYKAAVC